MWSRDNIGRMTGAAQLFTDVAVLFDGWTAADDASSVTHESHAALWARVRQGDEGAFKSLVLELGTPLHSYARRFMPSRDAAEDVVQDVLAHMWEQRTRIEVRGTVRGYLYTAVRNRALNERKRAMAEDARLAVVEADAAREDIGRASVAAPDAQLYRDEVAGRVMAALDALPPRTREVALLRWRDGLGRGEIAAVMGTTVPTVSNQLTQAAKVVRNLLADLRQ